jgi:hypothetical protein
VERQDGPFFLQEFYISEVVGSIAVFFRTSIARWYESSQLAAQARQRVPFSEFFSEYEGHKLDFCLSDKRPLSTIAAC